MAATSSTHAPCSGSRTFPFAQHCLEASSVIQCLQCEKPGAGFFGMVQEEHISGDSEAKEHLRPSNNCPYDLSAMLDRESSGHSKLKVSPEIYLCQQYLESELMAHKTMVHELIHAIDQCRTNMDPLHNCLHIACTEIRAENLSGECGFWRELPRMSKFAGHGRECVKRRAVLSVRGNPNCSAQAERYVEAALPRCFEDVYPFERHPNQK